MRLHVNLPGPVNVSTNLTGGRKRPAREPGVLGWVFAVLFVIAVVWLIVKALVGWWLSDWHWAWSTPLLLVGLIGAGAAYAKLTETSEQREQTQAEAQVRRKESRERWEPVRAELDKGRARRKEIAEEGRLHRASIRDERAKRRNAKSSR